MRHLLDTNTCIAILTDGREALTFGGQAAATADLAVSAITVWELECDGALAERAAENRARLDVFLAGIRVLPFGSEAARRGGELFAVLEREGLRLQTADCLIAGHALSAQLTLVTQDKDFLRVPGLAVVDWLPGGYRRGKK